jgi:hypothetical protein
LALVVVAVAGHAIAKRTERDAVLIVATLQADQGLVVPLGMHEPDGAQGMQILVNISEHALMAFPGIAEHLANGVSLTVLICTTRSRLMCTRHDRPYVYQA